MKKKKDTIKELEAGWKRSQADFENYRKRVEAERQENLSLAKADFITKITPVLDNFSRAFEHLPKKDTAVIDGFRQIQKQLEDILANEGLQKIPAYRDQKFDPALHEAVSCEENDKIACDHIIGEVESGWLFGDKVLKPAKVRVSKGK